MSLHDDLEVAVEQQRMKHNKCVRKAEGMMALLGRTLPMFFGGTERHYNFLHPTEPGHEGRTTPAQKLLPEDGGTFATLLVVRAGVNFACFLRFSDFDDGKVLVSLIGHDGITCNLDEHDEDENRARLVPFCQKLYKAAVKTITDDPRLATLKTVPVN